MHPRTLCFRWLAALGLGLLPVARSGAQDADSSPFLPVAGPGAPGAVAENEPLELHGIMSTSDGLRVCIYNVATKTSKWVGLNESGLDNKFVVKSADPDHDTASVLSDGRLLTLSLRKAKVEASTAGGWNGSNLPPGVSVVLNPTAADEQRRLQAIADEVRRRRLAREQNDRLSDQSGGRMNNR